MSGESLVTYWTPNTFLMKCVQLMLVIHMMIFAPDIAKSSFTYVTFVNGFGVGHSQVVS